jgi:hypothetical protein
VKTIADALGVARSNLANTGVPARRRGRPAKPEAELLAEIKQIIADQPIYGYRRVHRWSGDAVNNKAAERSTSNASTGS